MTWSNLFNLWGMPPLLAPIVGGIVGITLAFLLFALTHKGYPFK